MNNILGFQNCIINEISRLCKLQKHIYIAIHVHSIHLISVSNLEQKTNLCTQSCYIQFGFILLVVLKSTYIHQKTAVFLPCTKSCIVAIDGLLLVTLHWYCPPSLPVTVKVWLYCAVTALLSTVIPPETVSESLVQVTAVAGPPVEVHVRVN